MTRILVTGAAGFLGSHLVDALAGRDVQLIALDNLRRGRPEHIQEHLASGRITFIEGDIRNYDQVLDAVTGTDAVFHLAAQSNVMGAALEPDYSFSTNVTGTYNLLKASAHAGVQRFIFASSREVYGEPEQLPAREAAATEPKNLYGASKLAGEAYCRAFAATSALACVVLRFGNLYGPRDRDRVIPRWLARAAAHEDLHLYGGQQILDFLHVRYAVEALLAAAGYAGFGPINVASGKSTSLRDLATRVLTAVGSTSRVVIEPARQEEVTRFVADVTHMRHELGVSPPDDPLDGLAELVRNPTRS